MSLEARLVQKLGQNLTMTPQLQQAIKLLALGRLEYKEAIEKELLENPLLEEAPEVSMESKEGANLFETGSGDSGDSENSNSESEFSSEKASTTPELPSENTAEWEAYIDSLTDSRDYVSQKGLIDFEDKPSLEATLSKSETLQEHLLDQVRMMDVTELEKKILIELIGNLDPDGYLCCDYEEIEASCSCSRDELLAAMELIKCFEPVGVGARNLPECLLIQLDSLGLSEALPAQIIQKHLDKLEKNRLDTIAKLENVPVQEVIKAVEIIQQLEPKPGRTFEQEAVRYVEPDVYVQKIGNEYVVSMNDDGIPRLTISQHYADLLKDGDATGQKAYLNERLKAASWLIKSIQQRQQTIFNVASSIIKFQKEFLDHGVTKLKPLVLKDVADDIGMHESTVSRVTTNKFIHTPQGVFELKHFFSNGLRLSSGDEMSSFSIKDKIKHLIAGEDSKKPLSDQDIVEILGKEKIEIARRTVAKYREGLGIASSAARKVRY